jgi:hypothetical protein
MSLKTTAQVKPGNEPDAPAVPKLAYTPKETAAALGIAPISVYRLLKRGMLKSSSALRHKLIPVAEIQRFLTDTTR